MSVAVLLDLLPLTVPEVRRLLCAVVWQLPLSAAQILQWSAWRRRHRAGAKQAHSKRRQRSAPVRLYYQALRQDPRVVGLILLDGSDSVTAGDPARLALAEQLVAEGQEDALLPLLEGIPLAFALGSAAHLVHWEHHVGHLAAEGHPTWIASIRTPMLATAGTADDEFPNLRADLEDMRTRAVLAPRFDVHIAEGADHFYRDHEGELAKVVADWLDALVLAP